MTIEQTSRLAEIRSQWMQWGTKRDTSTWESTFFFKLLDEKNAEIKKLRRKLQRLQD